MVYSITGPLDVYTVKAYIKQMSPIYPGIDGRLRFYEDGMECSAAMYILPSYMIIVMSAILGYLTV